MHNIHLAFRFHGRFNVKIACNFFWWSEHFVATGCTPAGSSEQLLHRHLHESPNEEHAEGGGQQTLCKGAACHMKVSFSSGGLLNCARLRQIFGTNFSDVRSAKGRQSEMSLQAAGPHRVWCPLADVKICRRQKPTYPIFIHFSSLGPTSLQSQFTESRDAPCFSEILIDFIFHPTWDRTPDTNSAVWMSSCRFLNGWHLWCPTTSPRNGWLCISNAQVEWWISSQHWSFGWKRYAFPAFI